MEVVSNSYTAAVSFIRSVIEWRSAATAPYFVFINSAFWWSVFYLDSETQLRLLVSLAAGVFGWDVLLSSTHERSILFHILTWPIRNVLRTASVAMALYSAESLYRTELERACWTAYMTVVLLMLNPVWQYQQVPQKINGCLYTVCVTTKDVTQRVVISPLCSFYRILEYIVLLRWLPVVLEKVRGVLLRIRTAVRTAFAAVFATLRGWRDAILNVITSTALSIKNFVLRMVYGAKNGICGFCSAVKNCIVGIFTFCKNTVVNCAVSVKNGIVSSVLTIRNGILHVVTSTIDGITSIITAFKGGVFCGFVALKNGIFSGILAIKNGLVTGIIRTKDALCFAAVTTKKYIHDGIVALRNSLSNLYHAVRSWIRRKILEPMRNAYRATIEFLRYWLCAHWWPSLKAWLILHVGRQLQRLFNYFCFGLVYVFCGYWVNPVGAFLSRHLKRFYAYFQRVVLVPLKIWAIRRLNDALIYIRQMLHNLAVAIRDSVLWPFCLLLVALLKQIYAHFHRIVLQPIFDALYQKYKIGEDYVLIHFLGPVCQVFVDHIPDKSPFCDDTDTELADLLPPGFDEEEESDTEATSDKPSLPSRSLSPLTEDENDFLHGLKFPTVDASDSSEDEFSLKPKSKSKKPVKKKSKSHPKDPAPSVPNGELDSAASHESTTNGKDNRKNSSSASSSSAQYALDDADLRDLDLLDSELEGRMKPGSPEDEKIQKPEKNKPEDRIAEGAEQKKTETMESQKTAEQAGADAAGITDGLDGSFELLDK